MPANRTIQRGVCFLPTLSAQVLGGGWSRRLCGNKHSPPLRIFHVYHNSPITERLARNMRHKFVAQMLTVRFMDRPVTNLTYWLCVSLSYVSQTVQSAWTSCSAISELGRDKSMRNELLLHTSSTKTRYEGSIKMLWAHHLAITFEFVRSLQHEGKLLGDIWGTQWTVHCLYRIFQ